MSGPRVKIPAGLVDELRNGNPYCCAVQYCKAAIVNLNDLPPETVLSIASPGWRWDGKRMWCPKHATVR